MSGAASCSLGQRGVSIAVDVSGSITVDTWADKVDDAYISASVAYAVEGR